MPDQQPTSPVTPEPDSPTGTGATTMAELEQRSATVPWRVAGVIGLLIAAGTAWITLQNYPLGTLDRPGHGLFPLLVAVLMAIASAVALVEARGATFGYEPIAWRRFGIGTAVVVGGACLLPLLGFIPVTLVGTTVLGILIEGKFHWKIPLTMTATTFAIWVIFELVLGIRLP